MFYSHDRANRSAQLVERFQQVYPDAHCELDFAHPLQLLVATILSAQCTDKRVNLVTPALFAAYPDAKSLAAAELEDLERLIQSAGFFRSKAKNIRSAARDIVEKFGGEVPRTLAELITLAGVGRKTANVVLGNAFGLDEGIVVDTHVARVGGRLGLTKNIDPLKIEADLVPLIPRERWTIFSHWLIWHGRRRCFARNPDCAQCEVATLCPSAGRIKTKHPAAKTVL